MVIFTETMAKLCYELADHGPTRVSVTEDSVTIECGTMAKGTPRAKPIFKTGSRKPRRTETVSKTGCSSRQGKRTTYTFNGETHTVKEWAEIYGVKRDTMAHRLRRGSPEAQARQSKSDRPISKQ